MLEFDRDFQTRIGYKKTGGGKAACKVGAYYQTDWMPQDTLPLSLAWLNLDAVYENFVRQIIGSNLTNIADSGASLKDAVDQNKQRQKLLKQVAAFENKIEQERQFNKYLDLNAELKLLKDILLHVQGDE